LSKPFKLWPSGEYRTANILWSARKLWTAGAVACLGALVLAALILRQSFGLTALSDIMQCLLLLSGTASLIVRGLRLRGRFRLFWMLLALGVGFWLVYQLLWTYYEVWLRADVPDLWAADIIIFLHIVPLMAALALRPHAPQDEYSAPLRHLDFALLLVWWAYLYILVVIPWQYVAANVPAYSHNLNSIYLIEKLAFLGALFAAWWTSTASRRILWRTLYASLFGASLTYAASSYVANWALGRNTYYSGSLYDIPLAVSMAWITLIGLWTPGHEPEIEARSASTSYGLWLARLGMITVFSLPIFAAWALWDPAIPARVRSFRVMLTLSAALGMGVMVFLRQRLLDRELRRLLDQSQESYANLKRLQAKITESEKLASIGQLVGGAAHELNNPITAMLGYSDLLLTTPLNSEQNELAAKIGQQTRRAKSLVASLLNFAKQGPAIMSTVSLNTVLRTAVKLSQPQAQALKIDVQTEFESNLPNVWGDSNQLLQVCVQTFNNALHAANEAGSRSLIIAAKHLKGTIFIHITHAGGVAVAEIQEKGLENSRNVRDSTKPFSGLGLSACQNILHQHKGEILWSQDEIAGTSIRIELPATPTAQENQPEKSIAEGLPVMWESQPFA
jgi:signal transduction histidine kinase